MSDLGILTDLAVVVLGAAATLLVLRPFGVPPILAFMITGLLVGPLLNVLDISQSIELFSELGVALLLFVVGLELSIEKIRDLGRPAVVVGLLRVLAMFTLGGAIALAFGFGLVPAIFLGLAASVNSTVVVVKLLDRAGERDALHGRLAIGVLLMQDVIVVIVLTLVVGLSGVGGEGSGGAGAILRGLGMALLGLLGLMAVAAAAVRWVLPRVFAWLSSSGEALFVASLAWAFGFILAAEAVHLSIELGAFVAGVALAQLPYSEALDRRCHPLVDFFLAIFFVALGAGMDPVAAMAHLPAVIALSLFVIVGGVVLTTVLIARMGFSGHTAFRAGAVLSQISEFAFILLGVGVSGGLIEQEVLSLVGLVGLITISVSAVLGPKAEALYQWLLNTRLRGWLGRTGHEDDPAPARSRHVVIVGMNTLGRTLVHRLVERGEEVLAIDTDARKLAGLPSATLVGSVDDVSVLERADIAQAKLVVSALQIEDVNSMLVYRCSALGVPISVHAHDPTFAHDLLDLGADHLMVSKLDGIRPMQDELRRIGVLR